MIRFRPIALFASLSIFLMGPAFATAEAAEIPKVGETAPDFTLKTPGGDEVGLKGLRERGPVVLVVLRGWPGYQCPLCTKQVGELIGKAKEFESAGAQLVFVYPGPSANLVDHAQEFVGGKAFPKDFHFLIDPDYTFTQAYGLRWEAPRETAYPSTFVIDGTGKVVYAKISHSHGDRAPVSAILKALPEK